MSVELTGAHALQARLMALQSQGKPIMGIVGTTAVREQKKLVPVRTGNLRRTIHLAGVTAKSATTEASAVYARAIEFGGREYDIRAKPGKTLRFPAKGAPTTLGGRVKKGGKYAFAKVVHHPKTKAQPFMLPGARRALDLAGLKDLIVRAWNEAA